MRNHQNIAALSFLALIFLGLFSFSWIFERRDVLSIGHGMSLDGLRNYFLLLFMLIAFAFSVSRNSRITFSIDVGLISFFVVFAILSSIYALSFSYAVRDSIKLSYPLLFYVVARSNLRDEKTINFVMNGIIWLLGSLVIFTAGNTLLAYKLGWYSIQPNGIGPVRIGDLPSTYSLSSGPTVLLILLVTGHVLYKRQGWGQFLLFTPLAVSIVLITITRSYIIGMLLAVLSLTWTKIRGGFIHLVAGLAILYTTFVFAISKVDALRERMFWSPESISFWTVFSDPTILINEEWVRTSGRNSIWSYMISELHSQATSILGGGIGSTKYILMGGQIFKGTTVAHGDYAKYFAELGYIGLVLFILMILFVSFRLYQNIQSGATKDIRFLNAVLFASFVYMAVVGYGYEIFGNGFEYMSLILVLFAIRDNLQAQSIAASRKRLRQVGEG